MRHRKSNKKFGRDTQHRGALARNLVAALIRHERVITTVPKAKYYRRFAEKLITLGKVKTLARYRRALSLLHDEDAVKKLFDVLGPRYKDRPGGYTRVLKLQKPRLGDKAPRAIFELVDSDYLERKEKEAEEKAAQDKKKSRLKAAAAE